MYKNKYELAMVQVRTAFLFVCLFACFFGYNAFLSLLIQLKNVTALNKRSFEFKIAVAR